MPNFATIRIVSLNIHTGYRARKTRGISGKSRKSGAISKDKDKYDANNVIICERLIMGGLV